MTKNKARTEDRIAKLIGSNRVIDLPSLPSHGPLDLLHLRREVGRRMRSSGGRFTDPDWNLRRLVPFREDRWSQLTELARDLSSQGSSVSPSQLAGMLIERALDEMATSK